MINYIIMIKKKALCIGFSYSGTDYPLRGTVNDANNMSILFKTMGYDTTTYTDEKNQMNSRLVNLVDRLTNFIQNLKNYSEAIITFSTHGSLIPDTDNDEMVLINGKRYDEGIVCRGPNKSQFEILVDDDFTRLLINQLNKKIGIKLFLIIDCCHSGTVVDLKYRYSNGTYDIIGSKMIDPKNKIMMLSACLDHQYSYETLINGRIQGVLSYVVINALNQLKKKPISITNLYNMIRDNLYFKSSQYPQYPSLISNTMEDMSINISQPKKNISTRNIKYYMC